jgi:hypothetical protein
MGASLWIRVNLYSYPETCPNFSYPSRHNIPNIVQLALKEKIIRESDLSAINDLRSMRNIAAHSNIEYTKKQAEYALQFLKSLLEENA